MIALIRPHYQSQPFPSLELQIQFSSYPHMFIEQFVHAWKSWESIMAEPVTHIPLLLHVDEV